MSNAIAVHPLTDRPNHAWNSLKGSQKFFKLKVGMPPEKREEFVRFVCMSDTHSLTPQIKFDIPDGDVLIHAGDFTKCGHPEEVKMFNEWLGHLPHKLKIVIAGNHELSLDQTFTKLQGHTEVESTKESTDIEVAGVSSINLNASEEDSQNIWNNIPTLGYSEDKLNEAISSKSVKELLTNCVYLEDSLIVYEGIKIYGSPWQPEYLKWAFNVPRGRACLDKWELIPSDADILVTHTPPLGHGDLCGSGHRAGCVELLATVQQRVKPKYHVFGHVHEGYGVTTDTQTIFINASSVDMNYLPTNKPVVFDFPRPKGISSFL